MFSKTSLNSSLKSGSDITLKILEDIEEIKKQLAEFSEEITTNDLNAARAMIQNFSAIIADLQNADVDNLECVQAVIQTLSVQNFRWVPVTYRSNSGPGSRGIIIAKIDQNTSGQFTVNVISDTQRASATIQVNPPTGVAVFWSQNQPHYFEGIDLVKFDGDSNYYLTIIAGDLLDSMSLQGFISATGAIEIITSDIPYVSENIVGHVSIYESLQGFNADLPHEQSGTSIFDDIIVRDKIITGSLQVNTEAIVPDTDYDDVSGHAVNTKSLRVILEVFINEIAALIGGINQSLEDEIEARQQGDSSLQEYIDLESEVRESSDTNLQNQINNIIGLTQEQKAALDNAEGTPGEDNPFVLSDDPRLNGGGSGIDSAPIAQYMERAVPGFVKGYLQVDFNNAVPQSSYPKLYEAVKDAFLQQHLDAGDPTPEAGYFYPTPIPGPYSRAAYSDFSFTDASIGGITGETTPDVLVLRNIIPASLISAYRLGSPFRFKVASGTPPTSLSDGMVVYIGATIQSSGNTYTPLYETETLAIAGVLDTAIRYTGAGSGSFSLSQAGLVISDAIRNIKGPVYIRQATDVPLDDSPFVPDTPIGNAVGSGTASATPAVGFDASRVVLTSNENRPLTQYVYRYIKAEQIDENGTVYTDLVRESGWITKTTPWSNANPISFYHGFDSSAISVSLSIRQVGNEGIEYILGTGSSESDTTSSVYITGFNFSTVDINTIKINIAQYGTRIQLSDGTSLLLSNQTDWQYNVRVKKIDIINDEMLIPHKEKVTISNTSDVTINLPDASAATADRTYWVEGSGTGQVIFATQNGQTINGSTPDNWKLSPGGMIKLSAVGGGNWQVETIEISQSLKEQNTGFKNIAGKNIYQITWTGLAAVTASDFTNILPIPGITAIENIVQANVGIRSVVVYSQLSGTTVQVSIPASFVTLTKLIVQYVK